MRMRATLWIGSWAVGALALGLALAPPEAGAQQTVLSPAANKATLDRGAIVFRSSCAVCHKDPKAFAKRFSGKDPKVRGIPFEEYLATHNPPQPGPRRDLIAYLKAL
jgi:mono/diheme cytochrome c family protein